METKPKQSKETQSDEQKEIDRRLIKRIATHDAHAFNQFCQLHFAALYHFLLRILRNVECVEEVINDAFFVVWQKANQFKFQSTVKTWLFGIAYKKALKSIEKGAKHAQKDDVEDLEELHQELSQSCPEFVSQQSQTSEQIKNALHALSPEHRAVMELTFYHGYSYIEISEIIGCPANTVKTRMFHARKLLKGHLDAQSKRGEL